MSPSIMVKKNFAVLKSLRNSFRLDSKYRKLFGYTMRTRQQSDSRITSHFGKENAKACQVNKYKPTLLSLLCKESNKKTKV